MFKNSIKNAFLLCMLACTRMQQGQAKPVPVGAVKKTRQIVTAGYLKQRTYAQEYLKIVQAYNRQELEALSAVIKNMQEAKQACKYSELAKIFSAYEKTSDKKRVTYCDTKEVLREKMEKDGASQEFLRELEALELGNSMNTIGDDRALDTVLTDTPPDLSKKFIAKFVFQSATDLDAYNQLFKKYKLLSE
ncbi:MAG: hypothetical protein ABH827_05925 [bacterium]